ncbi:hypothetical protein VTO73DRAFT_3909, partial [Trametes versicolor]
ISLALRTRALRSSACGTSTTLRAEDSLGFDDTPLELDCTLRASATLRRISTVEVLSRNSDDAPRDLGDTLPDLDISPCELDGALHHLNRSA